MSSAKPAIPSAIPSNGNSPSRPRSQAKPQAIATIAAPETDNELTSSLPCASPNSPTSSAKTPIAVLITTEAISTRSARRCSRSRRSDSSSTIDVAVIPPVCPVSPRHRRDE